MIVDPGPRPELTWLPVDRLSIDDSYQRSVDSQRGQKIIKKIAEHFRWSAFQAILATPSGPDSWRVIDGQHRVAAAQAAGLTLVPAVVVHGLERSEQALAFVRANGDRTPVSAQALYHAKLAAGDAVAIAIADICQASGITIEKHNKAVNQLAARHTAAVPMMQSLIARYDVGVARQAIGIVAEAWGDEPGALRGSLFAAAGLYLSRNGDPQKLRRALSGKDWKRELERAGIAGGPWPIAEALQATIAEWIAASEVAPPTTARPQAPAKPTKVAEAAPFKAGPLPGSKPAHGSRSAEVEEVAEWLRQRGRKASVIGKAWQRKCFLDGENVAVEQLYDAANELRRKVGLPEVRAA